MAEISCENSIESIRLGWINVITILKYIICVAIWLCNENVFNSGFNQTINCNGQWFLNKDFLFWCDESSIWNWKKGDVRLGKCLWSAQTNWTCVFCSQIQKFRLMAGVLSLSCLSGMNVILPNEPNRQTTIVAPTFKFNYYWIIEIHVDSRLNFYLLPFKRLQHIKLWRRRTKLVDYFLLNWISRESRPQNMMYQNLKKSKNNRYSNKILLIEENYMKRKKAMMTERATTITSICTLHMFYNQFSTNIIYQPSEHSLTETFAGILTHGIEYPFSSKRIDIGGLGIAIAAGRHLN